MPLVKMTSKNELPLPANIRKSMRLRPGSKMQVFEYENRIEVIPVRRVKSMRGFLKGIDTNVPREGDRV